MSTAQQLPSEAAAVLATIDPDAYSTGTETSDWASLEDFESAMAVIMAGTLGTSGTIDAKIEQASDSSGTGAKDVSGASITQLTQADTDQSDTQALINIRGQDLDVANGFDHIRISLTIGTAGSDAAAVLLGMSPRHGPASDSDLASVDEIVTT